MGESKSLFPLIFMLGKVQVSFYFEPRDIWVGVYWDNENYRNDGSTQRTVYVCLLPMLPIRFLWFK